MPRKGESAPWLKKVTAHTSPASGPGWGGPPKGSGKGSAKRTGPDASALKAAMPPEVAAAKKEKRKVTREQIIGVYETVALNKKAPHMARVVAADKWLDRIEGKAPQANVNYEGGAKTLEQLVSESMKSKE